MYVYGQLADGTFVVGYYTGGGRWVQESSHPTSDEAVSRMRYLNGAPLDDTPTGPAPAAPAAGGPHPQEVKKK